MKDTYSLLEVEIVFRVVKRKDYLLVKLVFKRRLVLKINLLKIIDSEVLKTQ